jgi:hypothetical protein
MFQMTNEELFQKLKNDGRTVGRAASGDEELGPLKDLPGVWSNKPNFVGEGYNIIALPFQDAEGTGKVDGEIVTQQIDYRLLLNEYNEELTFEFVDKGVPNRGIHLDNIGIAPSGPDYDQRVVALDYQQIITQITAEDFPVSGEANKFDDKVIHREPGLWLHMVDERLNKIDIARLSTIPHGDAVLALGRSAFSPDDVDVPKLVESGMPIGDVRDLNDPYLAPYKHFKENPFHDLDPLNPEKLLQKVRDEWDKKGINILNCNVLKVDSTLETGGIHNIPFIVKQANAASMKSTFWIMRIDDHGTEKMILQYLQIVILDFLPREDGHPGLVRWPHISINTLEKVKVF